MASVLEISRRINAERDSIRAYVPQADPSVVRETPRLSPMDLQLATEKTLAKKFLTGLGLLPKAVGQAFTFTMEGVRRTEDVFQATLLTGMGRIKPADYPDYVKKVLNGEAQVTGSEFMRLMVGQELWADLQATPIIPGWVSKVVAPDVYLGKQTKPVLSVGTVLAGATELFVSPFTVASFLPKSVFLAARGPMLLGKAGVRLGIDPATSVFTWPLRSAAHHMLGRDDFGLGAILHKFRDPQAVLPPKLFELLYGNASRIEAIGEDLVDTLGTVHKTHKLNNGQRARLWKHLFWKDQKLDQQELAALTDLQSKVIDPLYRAMKTQGFHKYTTYDMTGTKVINKWDPGKDLLRPFIGDVRSFRHMPMERTAPGLVSQAHIRQPWRFGLKGDKLPYRFQDLTDNQLDAFMALEGWAARNWRKVVLDEHVRFGRKGVVNRGFASVLRSGQESMRNTWDTYSARINQRLKVVTDPQERELLTELAGLGPSKYEYLKGKLRDITGHRAGNMEIAFDNAMDRMFGNVERIMDTVAQRSRVLQYFQRKVGGRMGAYGNPGMSRISAITGALTQNIVVATLGMNLGSAIRNTSQLLNTAAKEGIPSTIRGIYRLEHLTSEGRVLKLARNEARFVAAFNRQHYNPDAWSQGFAGLAHKLMGPFNATENLMRGIAGNVAAERWLAKSAPGKLFSQLSDKQRAAMVAFMRREAADTNFIYGVAGRSHLMMNPVLRLGTTLQSYSWKQAEFIARSFVAEGGAVVRLWGMNGWMLDMMDRAAGINGEQWIGWGFVPPNSGARVGSPFVQSISGWVQAMSAVGRDDYETYDKAMRELSGGLGQWTRELGLDGPEAPALLNSMVMAGTIPGVPILAIAKGLRSLAGFMRGELESSTGRSWIPITRAEALKSAFFTLHSEAEDRRLGAMDRKLRGKVDRELDARVRKFMRALGGTSGDEVIEAANALYLPVSVNLPLSGISQPGAMTWGFLGDEKEFFPHPEMLTRRIENLMTRKVVAGPVADMMRAGWALEVMWSAYITRALDLIERGAVRGLR